MRPDYCPIGGEPCQSMCADPCTVKTKDHGQIRNMSPRRIIRAQRMIAELGHADILDALLHAEKMRSALRVIHTWAGVPDGLDARHVRDLTWRALQVGNEAKES